MEKVYIGSRSFDRKSKYIKDLKITKDKDEATCMIAGTEDINLDEFPKLRVISRYGVGMDNINEKECKKRNILIYNTPNAPTQSVTELTLYLIFAVLRNTSKQLRNKTIGIIGYGRIGRSVGDAILNLEYNCKVLWNDIRYPCKPLECHRMVGQRESYCCGLEYLLQNSDIITLHIPLTGDTKYIIDDYTIGLMDKIPILINTSRRDVINEDVVYDALMSGKISGFGSDVNEVEGLELDFRTYRDKVELTNHIGSDTKECREEMEKECVKNLYKGLNVLE